RAEPATCRSETSPTCSRRSSAGEGSAPGGVPRAERGPIAAMTSSPRHRSRSRRPRSEPTASSTSSVCEPANDAPGRAPSREAVFEVLEVPIVQGSLGAHVDVETLDGVERVELEPGTESGTVIRRRGHGIPNLGRRGRGDLFLTLQVQTPKNLKKEELELLEE